MNSVHQDLLRYARLTAGVGLLTGACSQNAPLDDRSTSIQSGETSRGNVLEREEMTVKVTTMEELLAHRFPGVVIRRAGSRTWLEVRGPSSISSATEALIVVDGIESSSRGLLAMSPNDIQRIEVLKGATAAIYGVRGGNGVVIVTTRRMGQ